MHIVTAVGCNVVPHGDAGAGVRAVDGGDGVEGSVLAPSLLTMRQGWMEQTAATTTMRMMMMTTTVVTTTAAATMLRRRKARRATAAWTQTTSPTNLTLHAPVRLSQHYHHALLFP
jgi:hypothetical protein